jgi:hypothetical protein
VKNLLLCLTAGAAVSGLWVAAYANANRQPCTHGESSAAVAIYAGHVHVIRDVHQTGCTR